jgi:probable HAF family extracellular repeat protein
MQPVHRSLARRSLRVAVAVLLAGTACSDSVSEPGQADPRLIIDMPGRAVAVGAVGAEGWLAVRGRVIGLANLDRLAYQVGQQPERAIEVIRGDGDDGTFDVVVSDLTLGDHTVTLRAYDRAGIAHPAPSVTAHVVPAVREIPVPASAANALPADVNERGDVSGYWTDPIRPVWHAFLYRDGQTRQLGGGAEWRSAAPGLNGRGDVVGYVIENPAAPLRAMLWEGTSSHLLFAQEGGATAINDAGAVTGHIIVDDGPPRAFVYRDGQVAVVGEPGRLTGGADVNAAGHVVGTSHGRDGDSYAFTYVGGQTRKLASLGGLQTVAQAMNDAGVVVGYSEVADRTTFRAFLERAGQMRALRRVDESDVASYAYDINNRDVVVGDMVDVRAGQPEHWAFIYTGVSLVALEDLIGPTSPPLVAAYAISDRGEIVAAAISSSGWLRPVLVALPGGPEAAAAAPPQSAATRVGRRHRSTASVRGPVHESLNATSPIWRGDADCRSVGRCTRPY